MLRLPLDDLQPGERELSPEAARYLVRVHRMRAGDRCVAFDPAAVREADLEVLSTERKRVVVRIEEPRRSTRVATRPITLVQGVAKGTKLDAVVRDATELGATRVIAALCERSVKRDVDLDRCRRIALEAARQSGRGDMPELIGPLSFGEAVASVEADLRVLLVPTAQQTLGALPIDAAASVAVAVGPEGGITDVERASAERHGFVTARLGAFVLRTETACAAALGALAAFHTPAS